MTELRGKRIVVMGLGGFGGGAGAARFCATEGASVTVTDLRPASQLAASLNHLDGLPIRYRLGRHEESDFTSCDLVVVNPAVDPRDNPYLQASLGAGAILTSEIQLLIERLDRRRVIAVTGTAGKSTTVAMIGHLLQAAFGPRRVHLGGNIGGSLLNELDRIGPDDWVVLELSSFMLEMLADWSPHIAVLTNLRDNHLDRHGTFDRYAAAKQRIFEFQEPGDLAIVTPGLPPQIQPRVRTYTVEPPGVRDWPPLRIPGRHNRLNARIALCAAQCAGAVFADAQALERVLESFTGLPHRM
jgi:UDP-N-acetylmuramoylalanine--D-glutamate ligase